MICWGGNNFGQLGIVGNTTNLFSPPINAVVLGAEQIACGGYHVCVLVRGITGAVWCWGENNHGQLGTRSSGNSTPSSASLEGVLQVAAGYAYSCAVMLVSGGVRCWGDNSFGQLGVGNTTDLLSAPGQDIMVIAPSSYQEPPTSSQAFKPILSLAPNNTWPVTFIATGQSSACALMGVHGDVRCWGSNYLGQLGIGNPPNMLSGPSNTTVLTGVIDISMGISHMCALMNVTGGIRCWGDNIHGEIGYGLVEHSYMYAPIFDILEGALQISCGGYHTCVLLESKWVLTK